MGVQKFTCNMFAKLWYVHINEPKWIISERSVTALSADISEWNELTQY